MFQFPWFPPPALCVQAGVTLHDECWVSPFGHLRINAQSTAPRSFSQSLTSFIGFWRQGIHRWLFVAWKNKDARACSAVLKEHRTQGGSEEPATRADARGHPRAAGGRLASRGSNPSKRKRRLDQRSRARRRTRSSTPEHVNANPTVHQLVSASSPDRTVPAIGEMMNSLERR